MNFIKFSVMMLFLLPHSVLADEDCACGTSYLSLGAGAYNISRDNNNATDFRVEYRSGHTYLKIFKPWIGAEVTTETSLWGGAGILADLDLHKRLRITPSLGIGLYDKGDSDLDLDHPLQFRSQIEFSTPIYNQNRIGVALSHLSNADLGDDNPGAEVITFYYHYGF